MAREVSGQAAAEELSKRLARVRSRGEVNALGDAVDSDEELRAALLVVLNQRGIAADPASPGRRLVRAALAREEGARRRTNPIRRDEGFTCAHCGASVGPGGARVRDHCPQCLRGLHVDKVPGDRAAECGGVMDPVDFELQGRAGVVIHYRCRACGHRFRTRAHSDDQLPGTSVTDSAAGDPAWEDARSLPRRVLEAIRRERLWEPGQRVLVAVSGGLDSTVLLELLWRAAGAHGGRVEVASVDHGLRPESVHEVALVGRRAAELGMPFHSFALGLAPGPGVGARAREARRAALRSIGADRIATGHHRDDQAETVLHHLLRGAGAAGLRGMRWLDPPWCRPLLAEPRAVLEAWARTQGLRWVDDPSNPASFRGRIRALMPELERLREGAADGLARSARLVARDDDLLDDLATLAWDELWDGTGIALDGWSGLHDALRYRVFQRLLGEAGVEARADQIEAALRWDARPGSTIELAAGARVAVEGGRMVARSGDS